MTTDAQWRKSSHSACNGQCTEAARLGAFMAVRDSKNVGGGHITLRPDGWRTLITAIKAGHHDLP
ncbi:DUF397 domain-containing protein [Thermomonospora umbrina]|uniref:Uncharacterized protein DUF397 n=1 Tax=Thermomonospora umbrina TaxID=111806 RepID=A0A3D9SQQ2_9ACTN|nr:DUF397 domain-containing protein [Thermomonospora umbrina]REE96303.1 uncharacterized protein DUF397 [Thermomonospora umbrina]